MSTSQTARTAAQRRPVVQFITGVTLFTAEHDQPEALRSTAAPQWQVSQFACSGPA